MTSTFLIVGAGVAGGRAAEALRDEGFDGRVVLVGDEHHRPYERPPLSKELLRGDEADPFLRDADWYDQHDVELRTGVRMTRLDPSGEAELSDGASISFDRCLLATGAIPRTLPVDGADLDGILLLRTLDDARRLREALGGTPRVAIVGAGFIGLEVAASARSLGCDVTVVEMLDAPLQRVLGPRIGGCFASLHRDHGVDLRLGTGVERFLGSGRVESVETSAGRLDADLVVVGVGVRPNDDLARDAGLEVDDGIVVDERLRTSAERVYAVGDVANRPWRGRRIRVEHHQSAERGGAAAARSMLGSEEPFTPVPWFWSDQYDLNLQMLGHPSGAEVVRGDLARRDATVMWIEDGSVTAAVTLDRPGDIGALRRLIEREVRVDPSRAADEGTSLRDLLRG